MRALVCPAFCQRGLFCASMLVHPSGSMAAFLERCLERGTAQFLQEIPNTCLQAVFEAEAGTHKTCSFTCPAGDLMSQPAASLTALDRPVSQSAAVLLSATQRSFDIRWASYACTGSCIPFCQRANRPESGMAMLAMPCAALPAAVLTGFPC